ncbi:hypothetical protein [Skermania sp. ID1734]|uniref:hypothetical protein n=1 Tax=Skermania sp. ID1734 TaxID=2597516 RepID=UPI00163D6043|nr:hypothetical protein [Skermania sp. ID1734]
MPDVVDPNASSGVRLAESVASLSLATDLGLGQPPCAIAKPPATSRIGSDSMRT